ncbi:hypothetical protein [Fodinibius halophilus]|uniref:Uncharacterized protein n=1 Tax=Fodinibius halophilus TaxID=1736908 RepID=A0A6M1T4W8_9BACT|nr:hypothetical protein [Fodinibius halophilus]NGP88295.1 hypothetical protein [Fodinibius halophilus]
MRRAPFYGEEYRGLVVRRGNLPETIGRYVKVTLQILRELALGDYFVGKPPRNDSALDGEKSFPPCL